MPNRIIKESICVSRKINELAPEEEVFFYRLLVNCDDYGCFYGDPGVLSAKLFPRRRHSDEKIRRWLDRICSVGLARRYQADGEEYILVNKWDENQQVRARRRKFPECIDTISEDSNGYQMISDECDGNHLSLAPAESNPIQSEYMMHPQSTPRSPKKTFGEFDNVKLTEDELQKLEARFGKSRTEELIGRLSGYIESKGVKYRSHYATILNWTRRDGSGKPEPEFNFGGLD